MKTEDLKYRILARLKNGSMYTRYIYSIELEKEFEVNGPKIREIIRGLRREGIPIGNSSKGYYYARDYSEIKDTVNDLRSRALSMIETATKMESNFLKPEQLKIF